MIDVNLLGGLGVIKAQIKREFVYRFNFFVWSIVIPSWIIMDYFLWRAIYVFSGQTVIRGMTFEALISYYIASLVIGVLADAGFDDWIADKIRSGKLIKFINYPMSFVHFIFFRWFAGRIINLFIFIPPLFILGYYLVGFNILESNILLSVSSIVLAGALLFLFTMVFALIAFWFKDIRGVKHLRQGLTWFLSGAIIPLNFFPVWFQSISNYLPFQYMRYIPAQIMIGSAQVSSTMILWQVTWVVVMLLVVMFVWKQAYRQFTGVGV